MVEIIDKKQEIQRLLNALDPERLSKENFVTAFEQVVKFLLANEQKLADAVARLEDTYRNLTERNQGDYVSGLTDLKGQVNDLFVGDQLKRMDSETKSSVRKLEGTINSLIEKKLKDADRKLSELDTSDKTSKKNLEGLSKAISANLELKMKEMDTHKSLKDEVIEELKKEMTTVKDRLANIPRGQAMGRAKSQITRRVDLTSQVDGNTRSFTLPRDTLAVLGIQGSQFPFTMADVDFTLAGNVMTLGDQVATPAAGQTLVVLLDVLFYP